MFRSGVCYGTLSVRLGSLSHWCPALSSCNLKLQAILQSSHRLEEILDGGKKLKHLSFNRHTINCEHLIDLES